MAAANHTQKNTTQSTKVKRMSPSKRAARKPMSHWGREDVKKILAERQMTPRTRLDPLSAVNAARASYDRNSIRWGGRNSSETEIVKQPHGLTNAPPQKTSGPKKRRATNKNGKPSRNGSY